MLKTRSPIPFIITIGIAMAVTGYSRVMRPLLSQFGNHRFREGEPAAFTIGYHWLPNYFTA